MKCPKCSYPNQQGVTYCSMCYEVFNRSAADRYMHAQKRARMQRDGTIPDATPASPEELQQLEEARLLSQTIRKIDWEGIYNRCNDRIRITFQKYSKEVGGALAIIAVSTLALFLWSPAQRMYFFGHRLEYHFPPNSMTGYLSSLRTEVKSWSERGGRLDTPLDRYHIDETGNIDLKASALIKQKQYLKFQPREWIVNRAGALAQIISSTHPSLKGSQLILSRQGRILARDVNLSARTGRFLPLVLPIWPKEAQRPGDRWNEPVQWIESLGEWKILWKGRMWWEVTGLETRDGMPCVHLIYRAEVVPSLWSVPAWAKGAVRMVTFRGESFGDAYFDVKRRQMFWNDFNQEGMLSIPINNIYVIPTNMRVGRLPRTRWGKRVAAEPGVLIYQIKHTLGIRRS